MTVSRRQLFTGALATLGMALPGCAPLSSSPSSASRAALPDRYRLPRTVVPRRYEIRIEPDLVQGRFTGVETIEVRVTEPVSEIVLNALGLTISEARIDNVAGRTLPASVSLDQATERAHLRFSGVIEPGVWRLRLSFQGVLGDKLQGFYRSRVSAPRSGGATGEPETGAYLALTQFQSTDARRAFPCWDEPAFKAVFEVTLVIDRRLVALSNAAVVAEEPAGEDRKAVRFAPTIPLSTYLVAFVVGDLEATEPVLVDGVPLRIWSVRGRIQLARFALEVATFALRFFRGYYALPYPGDKLDLIAVPDFQSGAMENLGAVIFRQTSLLIEEERATPAELRLVADTVSHEIAHMWFGDLVTMAWWSGLWLNEAFATFMQMLVVDEWRPAWHRWEIFAVSRATALEIDGLRSTRPVEFEVRAPAEAEAMFDPLTYDKGSALVRMLERELGPETFRRGVRTYLARHRLANAETRDLWAAIGEASGRPIAELMGDWVSRPGYPLVSVRTEAGGRIVVFSQRRFGYQPDVPADLWQVPVHWRARLPDGLRSMRLILSSAEARVELPAPAEWVVVNEGGAGFYRTWYTPELLAKLAGDLFGRLAPIERFSLVSDAWAACLAGLSPLLQFLDLTGHFGEESDRNVWTALLDAFTHLERVTAEADRPALAAWVRERLAPVAGRLGWAPRPDESEATRELRGDLLRGLGILGDDAAAQSVARDIYARYRKDPSGVHPSLVSAAVAVSAHAGTEADYAAFLESSRAASTPVEEFRYLMSLARFRLPDLIDRTLRLAIGGQVRSQDAPFLVRTLLLSVTARERAWRFVKENWDTMRRLYGVFGLAAVCEGFTGLTTPALEAEVRDFLTSRQVKLGGQTLDQYVEKLRVAVAFGSREGPALATYLSRFRPRTRSTQMDKSNAAVVYFPR